MKKRYVTIFTFTAAMVLAGSIAYAADRRKKTRQAADESNNLSEEILKVEFLSAGEGEQKKTSVPAPVKHGQQDAVQADMDKEYATLLNK
ncbi:MAG TPA: hypothetical protein VFF53_14375 [Geobacteraceae bacterium]|nr:hypothetical protein [Geobacteraceae bacterium]